MKKVFLFTFFFSFIFAYYGQNSCSKEIILKEKYKDLDKQRYEYFYEQNKRTYEPIELITFLYKKSDEFDLFSANVMVTLIIKVQHREPPDVEEEPVYLFIEKYRYFERNYSSGGKYGIKSKTRKKLFDDNHVNYYRYIPLTADTLAGKLKETYQKYDSVFIGKHTWYKYELNNKNEPEMLIDRQVDYDTIYPVCWSQAIKLAKKKGVKGKKPKLMAPNNYPEEKQEKGKAFWIILDKKKAVKVDAYSGEVIRYRL